MAKYDDFSYLRYTEKSEVEKSIHEIEGCLQGIVIDQEINPREISGLHSWIKKYEVYARKQPFAEIYSEINNAIADNIISQEEIDNILWLSEKILKNNVYYDAVTADIQRLHGILYGIMTDGAIKTNEIKELENWLLDNEQLTSSYPYDEICSLLTSILKDGEVSADEEKYLKVFFSDFIDLNSMPSQVMEDIAGLKKEITVQGICSIDPEIIIKDHLFCFTGRSSHSTREEIAQKILGNKGLYKDNIVKDTNYLIIGDNGNPCWAFSCYGRKVEQAVNMRKSGSPIIIVHETDFWDLSEFN